jgi:Tol biopolymer transport system component
MDAKRFGQIEELYHAALGCTSEERSALLDRADPEVRREVESLLAQKGSFFDRPAWESAECLLETGTVVAAGVQLGPYRIEHLIGAGGMGRVFRATDTRLGRDVAIKIAHAKLDDRFEREARTIGSLNHPNICSLYDVGPNYLVMELVEGETLAARLKRGRLSLEQTSQYGAQIASALAAAHARGIVHRDLKPGNVMVPKAGVKVLDFGLAKSARDETLTAANAVMGTPAYMAPEQMENKACDGRTDIYALGLVLFEMAAGERTRPGERPQLDSLPRRLAHVIERCLARDPDDRWQSARDVMFELEWESRPDVQPVVTAPSARWRRVLPWALFAATALGLAAFAGMRQPGLKNAIPARPVRLQIPLPGKAPLHLSGALALSPDGRQLAFIGTGGDGVSRVYLRAMDSLEMRPLPGTESAGSLLFWKPDGRFIAFSAGGKLRKIDVYGGLAETVCSLSVTGLGGAWNADDIILFGQFGGPVMRVSAAGGAATPVTVLDASHGDRAHTEPHFLPDGRHFIYSRDVSTRIDISAASLDVKPEEQDPARLLQASRGATFAPSSDPSFGQILFLRGHTLIAQPFDARRLKTAGDPVRVVEEPLADYWGTGAFSVSSTGTLVYWSRGKTESRLTWFDAHGRILGAVGDPAPYVSFALSPDGTRALMSREEADLTVSPWMVDMSRGTSARYELGATDNESAVWAPDGRSVVFSSSRDGQMGDIYEKQLDGVGDVRELIGSNKTKRALGLSPDRRFLLYLTIGEEPRFKLWLLPLQGERKPLPLLRTEFDEPDGRLSPDGRWVAYVSNESGRWEVYVRPLLPAPLQQEIASVGVKSLISGNGGNFPRWRQDSKELYFIQQGELMAVPISETSALQTSVPQALFPAPPAGPLKPGMTGWAPAPDGKRFLFLVPEKQEAAPLTVVLNWQEGLKK